VLANDICFGSCVGRTQVLHFLGHAIQLASLAPVRIDALADRLVVVLDQGSREADESSSESRGHIAVLFVRQGEIVELQVVAGYDEALADDFMRGIVVYDAQPALLLLRERPTKKLAGDEEPRRAVLPQPKIRILNLLAI